MNLLMSLDLPLGDRSLDGYINFLHALIILIYPGRTTKKNNSLTKYNNPFQKLPDDQAVISYYDINKAFITLLIPLIQNRF
jgi:hypothetical protein